MIILAMMQVKFHIKDMIFRIHDVGGQRSERRKWLYLFDCVHAVRVQGRDGHTGIVGQLELRSRSISGSSSLPIFMSFPDPLIIMIITVIMIILMIHDHDDRWYSVCP